MDPTIIALWACCLISILIMGARLFLGRWCKKKFDIGDALTVVAIIFVLAHIALSHVVLLWKTNDISPSLGDIHKLSNEELRQRELGSKFTIVQRCLYISL
jgi:hypothetical protein